MAATEWKAKVLELQTDGGSKVEAQGIATLGMVDDDGHALRTGSTHTLLYLNAPPLRESQSLSDP